MSTSSNNGRRHLRALHVVVDDLVACAVDAFERNERLQGKEPQSCRSCTDPACCEELVPITYAEGRYLARAVRELPLEAQRRIRARLDSWRASPAPAAAAAVLAEEAGPLAYSVHRVPCPLIEAGRCLVYEQRPMICRTQVILGPPNCRAHLSTGAPRGRELDKERVALVGHEIAKRKGIDVRAALVDLRAVPLQAALREGLDK